MKTFFRNLQLDLAIFSQGVEINEISRGDAMDEEVGFLMKIINLSLLPEKKPCDLHTGLTSWF